MPTTEMPIPSEVAQTVYGVEGWLDLPLISLSLLLTLAAVFVTKRKFYLLLSVALACFAFKHVIFYLDLDPTPPLTNAQQWAGTLGWLFVAIFAGTSLRRSPALQLTSAE